MKVQAAKDLKKKQDAEKNKGKEDEDTDDQNRHEGVMPDEIGPDGVPLWRNPSDVMNNFFIDYVAKSFTDRGNLELA